MPALILFDVFALLVFVLGAAYWHRRYGGGDTGSDKVRRDATRPHEVALAALVALCCLLANALAVNRVEPLSIENLGPLALAYHHREPPLAALSLVLLLLVFGAALPEIGRVAAAIFAGATIANVSSLMLWNGGAPDYIVFRRIDVIANVSDLLMLITAPLIAVSIASALWQHTKTRKQVEPRRAQLHNHP